MPLIVDHDERRREIAAVVAELIYERGIEATTVRSVAERMGCSPTIVSHYFVNKRELFIFTYAEAWRRSQAKIEVAFEEGKNLAECFYGLLPIDRERRVKWHIWFAFWGKAADDPEIAAERFASAHGAQMLLERILRTAQRRGDLPEELDAALHATRLGMMLNGLASMVILNPRDWPERRQKQVLQAELDIIKNFPKIRSETLV